MKKYSKICVTILFIMFFIIKISSAQEIEQLTDINVKKNVLEVTDSGWILINVEITNRGEKPIYEIEINEYYNVLFDIGENITIIYGNTSTMLKMPSTSGGQIIISINQVKKLETNEIIKIRYWTRSFKSGDFLIPYSQVWYSFDHNENTLRQNMYSNGLLVHIRSYAENLTREILPYIISGGTFVISILVIRYIRNNFRNIEIKKKKPGIFR